MTSTKAKPPKPQPKENPKSDWVQLQYRIDRKTRNELKAMAALNEQNTEDFLRDLIRREIAKHGISA